ncbi:alpha mannosidase [Emiliania huxleyi CCMP1516]|uniref:Glycoside hydrolase family 38 central domain-containing protein n=2 Tax=Emiliania huxleyi TaxID=2903 RepID=A0A0D3IWX0_EMIH1|nr:alpha mannosidase [Emiliania huxleyi CCMP1516]EOD15755.1 alpha mannosidase [Emiliania huxleyi CCMP1516]|eukprot:XP_005768184.1 alpha mannosidase [Emiliania huxleyi CCMP1516]
MSEIMIVRRLLPTLALLAQRVRANGCHDAAGKVITGLAQPEESFCTAGALGEETPTIELFRHKDPKTRGEAPYPFPPDRKYNTSGGPVSGKINVHLVPHTHDDTGWQVTVDQYFASEVFYVIDTVITTLAADPNRKFIYVETAFFARWWEQAPDEKRATATRLVQRRQLEFINGGWCMHDEASPLWTAMVDQTTRGHQFIFKHFGPEAAPKGTWQIDPFGHSNTQAWLLSAEAGMESLFWGRMDWQDRTMRYERKQGTNGFEWVWQGSRSLGSSAQTFAGNLFGRGAGGYSSWFSFEGSGAQVNDDPALFDYNVDQWVDKFVQNAREQASHTQDAEHQIWALGSDFQYQNADQPRSGIRVHADQWYRNLDKLIHYVNLNGSVNAFYSTPSLYVDQKKRWNGTYELRTDDIFPLADDSHNYWSGYFTSRPALKRQVRFATGVLASARQLEVVTQTTAKEVDRPSAKHAPVVGSSWTDSFEGTVGVATHHDGMSGTERQDVTDDYAMRISSSQKEVEAGIGLAVSKLLKLERGAVSHCHCHAADDCLNISVCAATTGKDAFTIAAWNPLAHSVSEVARIPVSGGRWSVTDGVGRAVPSQVVPLDERTKELPLLYLNSFGLSTRQVAEAKARLENKADHVLMVALESLPPVGLATFHAAADAESTVARAAPPPVDVAGEAAQAGEAAEAPAFAEAADTVVESDVFSLTFDGASGLLKSLTNKRSGATTALAISWGWYNSSVGEPRSECVFMCPDGTAGPIPVDTPWLPPVARHSDGRPMPNNWGKEVIAGHTWYTDSNGKEMVKRAGASLKDGEVEFMEPLNETMCGCNDIHAARRPSALAAGRKLQSGPAVFSFW